jgi:hypothetical protein
VHDSFMPLDYPAHVRTDHVLLWNEQSAGGVPHTE